MVTLGKWKNYTLTLSVKPNCLTISLEDPTDSLVYSFDCSGRLWTALEGQISYRRGLDGKIVAKWAAAPDQRERRWLPPEEARRLEEHARQICADLSADLHTQPDILSTPLPPEAAPLFQRIAAFSPARYQADVAQYQRVYRPVGILPPDQYMSVVLQASEGCSFNTCTFCTFYRDRPFRIKTAAEFQTHAAAVRDFLGDGLSLRRTIFLGDANALVIPTQRLLPMLDIIHAVYDVEKLGGIYAFLDGFSGEKKSVGDYRQLAARGVKRIYIGMESGNAELLKFLKKPGKPADVIQAVQSIKEAGISVGLIFLLGAGGHTYGKIHVRDTIDAVNAMHLDLDDLIYFSELIESENLPYTQNAYQQNLQPLTALERVEQGEEIERGLIFPSERGTPHISRYDIREFVY